MSDTTSGGFSSSASTCEEGDTSDSQVLHLALTMQPKPWDTTIMPSPFQESGVMKELSTETDLEDEKQESDTKNTKEMVDLAELNNNDAEDTVVNTDEVTDGDEMKNTEEVRDTAEEKDSGQLFNHEEVNTEELKEPEVMDSDEVQVNKDVVFTEKALGIEISSEEDNDIDMKDIVKKIDEGELNNIVEKMKEIREEVERKKNEESQMEEVEVERKKEERRKIDSRLVEIAME